MSAELLEFTRRSLEQGIDRTEIAKALQQAGWVDAEIAAALNAFATVAFPLPVPKPKPYLSAREVFVYLVLFAALYVSAYNLVELVFDFIKRAFPDPLQSRNIYIYNDASASIRWHIAALVVAFPLFLFMFHSVTTAIAKDPTKRGSRPRKWLTYLTLFIAAVTLICDLTALVYNALGGEITTRFALKVATIAVVAGGAFLYFLMDIRKDEET